MARILVVEPSHGGHRFLYVRYVVENLKSGDTATLLTSVGAVERDEFEFNLGHLDLPVIERFSNPSTNDLARGIAQACLDTGASTVLLMDADTPIKSWWWHGARAFRKAPTRPQVAMLLTRYPLRGAIRDPRGLAHLVSKAALAVLAYLTGAATRIGAVAGHDDMTRGLAISRVRDPAYCTAHSRDRAQLRTQYGLPSERRIVGTFGRITRYKNVPMLALAVRAVGDDVDLLVAGPVDAEVEEWLAAQPQELRDRLIVRSGFLEEQVLDGLLAACDVVSVALGYDRPSAVMGRALGAGVPIMSAGSTVRAHELQLLGGGISTNLDVDSIATALAQLLGHGDTPPLKGDLVLPTPAELAATLLGYARRPLPVFQRLAR